MRAFALSLLIAPPGGAHALGADDPEGIAALLREMGYEATVSRDESGNPVVDPGSGTSFLPWLIFFDGCGEDGCRDLRFTAWSDVAGVITTGYANDWNSYDSAARLYVMPDGTPRAQMALPEARGIPEERFRALVRRFEEDSIYGLFVAMEGL